MERFPTFLAVIVVLIGIVFLLKSNYVKVSVQYNRTDAVFNNPLMGFAADAKDKKGVGDNTLVYVDVTWREWEPEEGEYAIDELWENNHLSHWQREGKHIVLRFICDYPSKEKHMDIPDWLYELTKDGVFYNTTYGKGYAPEYSNPLFIEKHRNAILALGKAFDESRMVAYVQLGSLGHWGEWHMNYSQGTTRIPECEIRKKYVEAYIDAFPEARIMSRRPFSETAEYDMGLYNDMTGHDEATEEWLDWIENGGVYEQPVVPEELVSQYQIWRKSPIGGEFTSSLSYDYMLDENLEETISLIKQTHMTFIGPKCPVENELDIYSKGVEAVQKTLGYRYGISEAVITYYKWSDYGQIKLMIENYGTAPIYFQWPMYLYVYDEMGNLVIKQSVGKELCEVYGEESASVWLKEIPMKEGYSYWVGIENPATDQAAVYLDMDVESQNLQYKLFSM